MFDERSISQGCWFLRVRTQEFRGLKRNLRGPLNSISSSVHTKASLFAFFTADVFFFFHFALDMLNYTITFGAWNLRANCRHVKSYCRLSLFQHAHYTNHWPQRFLSLSCGRVNAIQKRSCGRKYFDAFSVKWKRIDLKTHTWVTCALWDIESRELYIP